MEKIQIIPSATFPGNIVSDAETKTLEFGLKIGQAIQYEWFKNDTGNSRYYSRYRDFNIRRLYARGEQPIQKYKDELSVDGDLSHLNLDWTPIPIIPKFVDVVANGMTDRLFEIKAVSQDALSVKRKTEFQDVIESEMLAKPVLEKISQDFGINPFINEKDEIPENDEELQLHMQLKYKPGIEIAEEIAISTILKSNHYDDIRVRLNYDLTVIGMGVARHDFLDGGGIEIKYVDPAKVIHSYTEDPFFKDCFYWGDINTIPISELVRIDPTITKEQLKQISQLSNLWYKEFPIASQDSLFSQDTCTILNFNYKTTKSFVYKKRILEGGGAKITQKDDQFNPPMEMMEEGRFEKIEKRIEVWYEGIMIAGTEIMLKWKLMENMVRPKSATQRAIPSYVACAPRMYKGSIESAVSRMIPFGDICNLTHMKLQQVVAKIVPDGVFIDADGLNEVDLGNGAIYTPKEALSLYLQTGSVIGRSFTSDGEFNNAKVPISPLNTSAAQAKIGALISYFNQNLGLLRDSIGVNEVRDGSTPHPDALVGVQKMAALSSNTATRHILDASLYISRTIAEGVSCRLSDLLDQTDFKDELINQIGKHNVSIIEDIKHLHLFDFGIFIELAPDEEEKQFLEQNIQMALKTNSINLEDAIDIREIKNIKLANQLLKVKRRQKRDYDQKVAEQQQQGQAQIQMQAQQMAAQTAMQKIQLESQAKIQVKNAESEGEIRVLQMEAQLKAQLMEKEFNFNRQLQGMTTQFKQQAEDKKEAAKDRRLREAGTQASELINQRKFDLPAKNFESNNDWMGGIGLGEFEP